MSTRTLARVIKKDGYYGYTYIQLLKVLLASLTMSHDPPSNLQPEPWVPGLLS